MNVESNGSHILVGRSSPPPNPDLEMGQTSGLTRSQGGSPMPRNSKEGQIMPGPQVFVTPSAMHTGQRVFGGRAGTIGAQRGAQASLSGAEESRTEECQCGGMPSAYQGISVIPQNQYGAQSVVSGASDTRAYRQDRDRMSSVFQDR